MDTESLINHPELLQALSDLKGPKGRHHFFYDRKQL